MKKEVWYICEICKEKYNNVSAAEECERQRIPNKNKFPVGLIFNNPNEGLYKDITFAIARTGIHCHSIGVSLWACRDNGSGDNLDKYCGAGSFFPLDEENIPDRDHPTFKRMVKALEKKGIPVTVWDGEKVVKL